MAKELTDFFQAKKRRADQESAKIDWDLRRADWLTAVDVLYNSIKKWLREPLKKRVISLETKPKQITEPHLGSYQVDELILKVGDEKLIFSPKGRNVMAAEGRVDVRGEAGESMFVLQGGSRWSIVVSRYPELRTEPLNEDSFNETVQAVMRQ